MSAAISDQLRRTALQHVGLIVTASLFGLMMIRVAVVSRLDPTTMVTLFAVDGPVVIAVSSLQHAFPNVVAFGVAICVAILAERLWQRTRAGTRYLLITLLSLLAAAMVLTQVLHLLIALVVITPVTLFFGRTNLGREVTGLVYGVNSSLDKERERIGHAIDDLKDRLATNKVSGEDKMDEIAKELDDLEQRVKYYASNVGRRLVLLIVVLMAGGLIGNLLSAVVAGGYWRPLERLEVEGREGVVIAYVLNEDAWLTIMRDEDRAVERIDRELVTARVVCNRRTAMWLERAPAYLLLPVSTPVYPECVPEA